MNFNDDLIQNFDSELPTPQILKEDHVIRTNLIRNQNITFNQTIRKPSFLMKGLNKALMNQNRNSYQISSLMRIIRNLQPQSTYSAFFNSLSKMNLLHELTPCYLDKVDAFVKFRPSYNPCPPPSEEPAD